MATSVGYNPFYRDTTRLTEVHVLHYFSGGNFYAVDCGLIRPERSYASTQDLIDDIEMDCNVARRSLQREAWSVLETGELDGSWQEMCRERRS